MLLPFRHVAIPLLWLSLLAVALGPACARRDSETDAPGRRDGRQTACEAAGARICAAACACGGCDILSQGAGATVRVESEDEASCVSAYDKRCEKDERTEEQLDACADAYETTECIDEAALQPKVCIVEDA